MDGQENKILEQKIQLANSISLTPVDDELIVFDQENKRFYLLNASSCEILSLVLETNNVSSVIEKLMIKYKSVNPMTLENDVSLFVRRLVNSGILLEY